MEFRPLTLTLLLITFIMLCGRASRADSKAENAGSPAPVAAAAPITEGDCGYDLKAGLALADIALGMHGKSFPQGACLKGVSDAVLRWSHGKIDLSISPPFGAKQTVAEVFENLLNDASGWFTPLSISHNEINAGVLPPGAIVVFSDPVDKAWSHRGGCGEKFSKLSCYEVAKRYGHIQVIGADRKSGFSDGRERLAITLTQWKSVHVYLPNSRRQGDRAATGYNGWEACHRQHPEPDAAPNALLSVTPDQNK